MLQDPTDASDVSCDFIGIHSTCSLQKICAQPKMLSMRICYTLLSYTRIKPRFHITLEHLLENQSDVSINTWNPHSYLLLLAFVTASLPRCSLPSTQDWLSQPGLRRPTAT